MPVEFVKHIVVAGVVAGLVANGDFASWAAGVVLGIALWVGFPVVLLISSIWASPGIVEGC